MNLPAACGEVGRGPSTRSAPSFISWACTGGLIEARLEVSPSMLPSHLDGGFHVVCQNDELGWSAVTMGAKADDVHLSHSGRDIAKKQGESKGGCELLVGL
jgi:hypothetical protein